MHRMDMRSREQYLKALLGRYLRARKRGKSALLDEYCRNTGMARKSVLRKIAGLLKGESPPWKQRRPMYGRPVRVALETLWEIFDRPCGQRLKPLVEEELGRLRSLGELKVDEKTARQLKRVSPATIDRLLTAKKTEWIAQKRYGRVGGNLIAKKIPLKMTDWDLRQVGFLEMDFVLHCGASTDGEYAHGLSAQPLEGMRRSFFRGIALPRDPPRIEYWRGSRLSRPAGRISVSRRRRARTSPRNQNDRPKSRLAALSHDQGGKFAVLDVPEKDGFSGEGRPGGTRPPQEKAFSP